MKKVKLDTPPPINDEDIVRYKTMGNIIEVAYNSHRNTKQSIQKLDKDHFIFYDENFHIDNYEIFTDDSTGEQFVCDMTTGLIYAYMEFEHNSNRAQNINSVSKSIKKLRELINANYDINNMASYKWVTLTCAENITDKDLFMDWIHDALSNKIGRWCKKNGYTNPKYIASYEPQARGAWHAHVIMWWPDHVAPYIPVKDFEKEIWQHGFVWLNKLDGIDNLGAYLSAYLTDIDYSEIDNNFDAAGIKQCKQEFVQGVKVDKRIIKGGRLSMYPSSSHMYSSSQGINRPEHVDITMDEAYEKIKELGATESFSAHYQLVDESKNYKTTISTTQYKLQTTYCQI